MDFKSKKAEYIKDFDDLRGVDLLQKDLSHLSVETLMRCYFDTETIWPTKKKLPNGFDPKVLLEKSKNPGLGLRELHKEGITGKGIHIAIIDQKLSQPTHEEYKVFSYLEFIPAKKDDGVSMHGPAVSSLLVGKNCGVAPDALIHYFAMPDGRPDFPKCAKILRKIITDNKSVSINNRVRIVSCSFGYGDDNSEQGIKEWKEAIQFAREQNVMLVDASENIGFGFIGGGTHNDKDDFESQDLWLQFKDLSNDEKMEIMTENIMVPSDYRTFASSWKKENQYMYSGIGGISWSIPYLAGVIALGLQVNPKLTQDQIIEIIKKTVYINKKGLRVIHPKALIEEFKKA